MSREISVTIKGGRGSEPWLVFRGEPAEVRADIVETFGYDSTTDTLTVAELATFAADSFANVGNLATKLGAVIDTAATAALRETPAPTTQPATATPPADAGPPFVPDAKPDAQVVAQDPVLASIAVADSLDAIQKVWLANQEAFNRPEVQEAVVARRKELGVA